MAKNLTFSEWLTKQLEDFKLEPSTIAGAAGRSAGYLSMLKSGRKTKPSQDAVEDIARAIARKAPPDVSEFELVNEALEAAGFPPRSGEQAAHSLARGLGADDDDFSKPDHLRDADRTLRYLLKQEAESKEVWVIRSNTYFLSGIYEVTRKVMINLLKKTDIEYNFVFKDLPPDSRISPPMQSSWPSPTPAKDSFHTFKEALHKEDKNCSDVGEVGSRASLFGRVHGYGITDKDQMLALGLGTGYTATLILLYRDNVAEVLGRAFDVFYETTVAVYDPDSKKRLDNLEHLKWLEVPFKRAVYLWHDWMPLLEQLKNSGTECFPTPESLKDYQRGTTVHLF